MKLLFAIVGILSFFVGVFIMINGNAIHAATGGSLFCASGIFLGFSHLFSLMDKKS